MISERMRATPLSATMAMTQKAADRIAAGQDVISLSAGEPDMDTPDRVKAAARDAINRGETKYTAVSGIAALKTAIARKFLEDNGITYDPAQIIVSPGGKSIIFNAFAATLDAGDEVIVPAPYWVSYPGMTRFFGAAPIIAETREKDGFILKPDALADALTPKTKWLILNSPNNPTGAVYADKDLIALAEVLAEHPGVLILSDDIYEHLLFDGAPFATMAAVAPSLFDRTLTMNGVSKAYAMTGWRIGYAGGPAWLINAMTNVMSQSTSNACSISQWAAAAAISGDQTFLETWRERFQHRRDTAHKLINSAPGMHCMRPKGAFYLFVHCGGLIGKMTPGGKVLQSDEDVAYAFLEEAGVAVVFGAAFGMSPYIRLSFATSDDKLTTACERIVAFCKSLR